MMQLDMHYVSEDILYEEYTIVRIQLPFDLMRY